MKTYVSYVIQDGTDHRHLSEVVTTKDPPYSYSGEPRLSDVLEWAEEKKRELRQQEELVIMAIYKV